MQTALGNFPWFSAAKQRVLSWSSTLFAVCYLAFIPVSLLPVLYATRLLEERNYVSPFFYVSYWIDHEPHPRDERQRMSLNYLPYSPEGF